MTVTPVNEVTPAITVPVGGYTATISEDTVVGTVIVTIVSTDADSGVHGDIRYSITGGNAQNHFSMEEYTGNVYVVAGLDREATDSYTLTVRATDSLPSLGDELYDETNVIIAITDVNDNYPTFVPSVYAIEVMESAAVGATLQRLTVTDDDIGVNENYDLVIISGNTNSDFALSGDDVLVAKNLDHEVNSYYDIVVEVADRGVPSLSSTARVIINVLSVNEYPPVFDVTSATVTIDEDIPVGILIYDANATDADANTAGVLKYAIESGDPEGFLFLMDTDTGKITLGSYLDYDTSPQSYTLNVSVQDNAGETGYLVDYMLLTIDLLDVNDNTPVFTQNTYSVDIDENIGDSALVVTVAANDDDSGLNAAILYSIDSGDGHEEFQIDTTSGDITTIVGQTLDRDTKDSYTLLVRAEDQGSPVRSSFCLVKISLNDINDNVPVFSPSDFDASLDENQAISTLLTSVYATDDDIGNNALLALSIDAASDPNSGHFSLTQISADTAEIYTTQVLDHENVNS